MYVVTKSISLFGLWYNWSDWYTMSNDQSMRYSDSRSKTLPHSAQSTGKKNFRNLHPKKSTAHRYAQLRLLGYRSRLLSTALDLSANLCCEPDSEFSWFLPILFQNIRIKGTIFKFARGDIAVLRMKLDSRCIQIVLFATIRRYLRRNKMWSSRAIKI